MSDTRLEGEAMVEQSTDRAQPVKSARRTVGAPRVQHEAAAFSESADHRPRSRQEIQARQDAMRETRRPTKPIEEALAEKNPKTVAVPDVAPTHCDERSK